MFQDYTPAGGSHQVGRQNITVKGKALPETKLPVQTLAWEEKGYKATLASANGFTVNSPIELKANVSSNGKPITDLELYLGALAHIVVVSEDTKEYLHVHPMDSEAKGPEITAHTNFPKAGKYKVFMQFAHAGKVHTASFVIEAK